MSAAKKLVGENIFLGPVSKRDIPKVVRWMNDLEVVKTTCQVARMHTNETLEDFMEKMLHDPKSYYFGIYFNDKLIGSIDLRDIDDIHKTASIGILIGKKEYWDRGYGTEAVTLLLDYGFSILNLNNIMPTVFDFNPKAIRCYEKAAFKAIGRRRKARFFAGRYYDEVYMDILAEDFTDSIIKNG